MSRWIKEYSWPVVTGLLAAALVVMVFPGNRLPTERDNPTVTPQSSPPANSPATYAGAVARAAPSVVNIYASKTVATRSHPLLNDPFFRRFFERGDFPQQQRMQSSLGAGVLVSDDGYILTNNHVVYDADEITVLLYDGREASATAIGSDADTDLAVLKIDLPNLTPIPIGNTRQAHVGDVVLAIGNPFGVGQSVSQGIISATGRGLGLNTLENFIQTDAAINPGNSGGALIDTNGNLLGINSAILNESNSTGLGFAIPADTATKVLEDIIRYGKVIRGWLGVQAQQLESGVAARMGLNPPRGLVITNIDRGGPAHEAGLMPGDIITHINGQLVGDGRQGSNIVTDLLPGDPIRLSIMRNGEILEMEAVAGIRPTLQ